MNRLSFLFILLVWMHLALCGQHSFASCRPDDRMCGPKCLLAVCQKLGVGASIEELSGLCGYREGSGVSMLGLEQGAKAKGLQCVAMKMSIEELAGLRMPAIAHLWNNHFIVVERVDPDGVYVDDPPGEGEKQSKERFQNDFSGFVLFVAKDAALLPKPQQNGPDLMFDDYRWDFGTLNEGDEAEHSFKCRNAGNAKLLISKIDTSCGDCVVVASALQALESGAAGEIRAAVVTAGQRRQVSKEVYVHSNDPASPVVHLAVTGYVRPAQLVFSPAQVAFCTLRRTGTAVREVLVPVYEKDDFQVASVSSDSRFISASLERSQYKELPGYLIKLKLLPGAPIGQLRSKITINSNHPKQPSAEIPVTATVCGNVDLDRGSFFLGVLKKGQARDTAVTVSTVSKDPLNVANVDSPLSYLTVDVKPRTEGKEYVLTATIKSDAPVGSIKGDVVVHTNDPDQPEIKIPVYAYVEE